MNLENIRKIAGLPEVAVAPTKHTSDFLSESMRKLAGLPLFEAKSTDDEDDSEDDTPTKRVSGGFGNLKIPEKAKEEAKTEEKEKPAKKGKDFVGPKKRGKAHNPASKSGVLRAWIEEHPGVKRSDAYAHAISTFGAKSDENPGGITPAGFSTLYQNARSHHSLVKKAEVKEAWVLMHPSVYNHILHENREMNQFQWVHFLNDNQEPMIFETEAEAQKIAKFLSDFKNQSVIIEHVTFEETE